ncbi:MAG: GatB/YqeY domain-containing protein [Desulfobulbaceae bacterium]|nr:GatB/YqeY domain-containing protein [Desulfobulbaceae bacterium]
MTIDKKYGWNSEMEMNLLAKMKADLKQAMRDKDTAAKDAIRQIMSEFPTKITLAITLESGKKSSRPKREDEIENDEIIAVIMGLAKSEKQTLEYKKETTSEYLQILELYLPKMASEEEITAWINDNIDFSQFKNSMQAMGTIMKHFGKSADGNLVKAVLQKI